MFKILPGFDGDLSRIFSQALLAALKSLLSYNFYIEN